MSIINYKMKTIVGFLSRPHGFEVLTSLINNPEYQVLKIFTHKLKPKSEDPDRSIRTDYDLFFDVCEKNNIPMESIDSINHEIECPPCDYIIEVSWRYLIPKEIVNKAKILGFGIHRGKLPDYAGKEPIKQALNNNESEIVLSAHVLDSIIDEGNVLDTITYKIESDTNLEFDELVQKIREKITPLFSKLFFNVLNNYKI